MNYTTTPAIDPRTWAENPKVPRPPQVPMAPITHAMLGLAEALQATANLLEQVRERLTPVLRDDPVTTRPQPAPILDASCILHRELNARIDTVEALNTNLYALLEQLAL